jgi:hypothetical protein
VPAVQLFFALWSSSDSYLAGTARLRRSKHDVRKYDGMVNGEVPVKKNDMMRIDESQSLNYID